MMKNISSFVLISPKRAQVIKTKLQNRLEQWAKDWMLNSQIAIVHVDHPLPPLDASIAYAFMDENNEFMCEFRTGASFKKDFYTTLMFPEPKTTSIDLSNSQLMSHVLRDALRHLGAGLCEKEIEQVRVAPFDQTSDTTVPSNYFYKGSAAIQVSIRLGLAELRVVMAPTMVSSLLVADNQSRKEKAKLNSIHESLRSKRIQYSVEIGQTEVSVNDLRNLKIGDVLRLDQSLNDSVNIVIHGKTIQCKAYLGQQNKRKSLKVVSLNK
ncbi:MAG: FliM/FliN family flagellar motor switch protein [Gammaproteobacteria bacterium]|nr:FliM/FliN family flagellar motor switch protein [Gammaproteobacteria bacterium]